MFFLALLGIGAKLFDSPTCLHLFYGISCAVRKGRCNFFLSNIHCNFMHTLSYPFLQTYVRLSMIYMNDFSLRDLPTFYLPPYVSIMLRNSVL